MIYSLQLGVGKISQISTVGTEIGLFSDSFVRYKLKELCLVEDGIQTGPFGSQLHMEDYVDEGTPIITVEHLVDGFISQQNLPLVSDEDKQRLSKYTLKNGDIVLSRVGSVDRSAIVSDKEDGWLFSGRCIRIRPDHSKVNARYIGWLLQHPSVKEYLRRVAVGLGMPSLNTKIVENLPIYLNPDLGSQQSVVENCDILHSLTALKYRIEKNLHEMISALFRSWFIDFDPVKAKAEGELPYGMDEETAALFPDSFEDSELGPIPSGWSIQYLADLYDIQRGFSYTGASLCEQSEGTAMINLASFVEGGGYKHTGLKHISSEFKDKFYIVQGDVFIATVDLTPGLRVVGSPLIPPSFLENQSIFSQDLLRLRKKPNGKIERGFLFHWLKIRRGILKQWSSGTTVSRFPPSAINRYPVLIPPTELLQRFEQVSEVGLELLENNAKAQIDLATTRDALLPRLMSGELSIS